MSLTAKSVLRYTLSLRPWAVPLAVKETCSPLDVTSAIHWLTAFELQDEPDPWMSAWLAAESAGGLATAVTSNPSSATVSNRTSLLVKRISDPSFRNEHSGHLLTRTLSRARKR